MKKIIILVLLVFIAGCGRWKTTKLKSDLMCTVNSGETPGSVMLKYDQDDILSISFKIWIYNDNIYIADNILKRFQVINKNCNPSVLIGENNSGTADIQGVKYSKFQFSNINDMVVDSNGNLYIQNSIITAGKNTIETRDFAPSYILVFDEKGTLLYTLGKTGSPDLPFNSIDSIEIDSKDRLYIVTRSYDTWSVYRFAGKRRELYINFNEDDFKERDGDETYTGRIEKITSYKNSDTLMIAVAYYFGADFKYRKIYNYSIQKEKMIHAAFVIPDPKNELFALVDDKYVYLWDIDEKNLRYMICSMSGDIVNNIAIRHSDMNDSYNEVLIDDSGRFYTYHVLKNVVEVLEWR